MTALIGTAGWTIPSRSRDHFPTDGSTLERYAAVLNCAEINSSFYRSHKPETWARWAASVPEDFRFSVKLPKTITHVAKLVECEALLAAFAAEVAPLGDKLGVVLVQLPPSFAFDVGLADAFFSALRHEIAADIAFEPRHATWFSADVDKLLVRHRVARVAADPAKLPEAARPGGWGGLAYYRLHGSPRMYFSAYEPAFIDRVAGEIAGLDVPAWCIFDNTGGSAAAGNALELKAALG